MKMVDGGMAQAKKPCRHIILLRSLEGPSLRAMWTGIMKGYEGLIGWLAIKMVTPVYLLASRILLMAIDGLILI